MSDAITTARKAIQERIHEIEEEAARLKGALAALVEGGSTKRKAGTSARRPSRRRRKVAPPGRRREQLVSYLKTNPGAKPSEIAKAIGTSPANVHNVLQKASQDSLVRKRRGGGYELSASAKAAGGSARARQSN